MTTIRDKTKYLLNSLKQHGPLEPMKINLNLLKYHINNVILNYHDKIKSNLAKPLHKMAWSPTTMIKNLKQTKNG